MPIANRRSDQRAWMIAGAIMGALAGVSFLVFKVAMAILLGGKALMPVRNIGAMVLGEPALLPGYSVAAAVGVGMIVHTALAVLYGAAFGFVIWNLSIIRSSRLHLLTAAAGMGFLVWLVNLYVFAPLLFPWFTENNPFVEITARVVFFGLPIGLLFMPRLIPKVIQDLPMPSQRIAVRQLIVGDD